MPGSGRDGLHRVLQALGAAMIEGGAAFGGASRDALAVAGVGLLMGPLATVAWEIRPGSQLDGASAGISLVFGGCGGLLLGGLTGICIGLVYHCCCRMRFGSFVSQAVGSAVGALAAYGYAWKLAELAHRPVPVWVPVMGGISGLCVVLLLQWRTRAAAGTAQGLTPDEALTDRCSDR